MMITPEELVRKIHARPLRIVVAVTGGGSQAIADLLRIPGGSRTVIEALVPYSPQSLASFLRATPEKYCSARTARAMAMAAFMKARDLTTSENSSPTDISETSELLGIGCTASLASDRPKRGAHRVHVAVQAASWTGTASLELTKGERDRAAEEQLVGHLILNEIAAAGDLPDRLSLELRFREKVETVRTNARSEWQALLLGSTRVFDLHHTPGDEMEEPSPPARERVLFPGAFHPLHDGHRQIAEVAEQMLGRPVEFEISIVNVDKPPLDYTEIAARVAQFSVARPLWLTRAPTFVEKSRLFPQATFLVGADTISRIADPCYYRGDVVQRDLALREIANNGGQFLVYGRVVGDCFVTLESLELPTELVSLCRTVPAELFRVDISSTRLRQDADAEG